MTRLALTPHKPEHFKGAMTLPACLLSLITPGQPTAVPHQKTKGGNPPNSNPKNLMGIFPLYFAYLSADLLISQPVLIIKLLTSL